MTISYHAQPWITLNGATSGTAITQPCTGWANLSDFKDVVAFLEVAHFVNACTMNYQTAADADESLFVNMTSSFTVAAGVTVTAMRYASATVPLARYFRWKISGAAGGAWQLTFRLWPACNLSGNARRMIQDAPRNGARVAVPYGLDKFDPAKIATGSCNGCADDCSCKSGGFGGGGSGAGGGATGPGLGSQWSASRATMPLMLPAAAERRAISAFSGGSAELMRGGSPERLVLVQAAEASRAARARVIGMSLPSDDEDDDDDDDDDEVGSAALGGHMNDWSTSRSPERDQPPDVDHPVTPRCLGSNCPDPTPVLSCTTSVDPCDGEVGTQQVCVRSNTCAGVKLDSSTGATVIQKGAEGQIASNWNYTLVTFQESPGGAVFWSTTTDPTTGPWEVHAAADEWDLTKVYQDGTFGVPTLPGGTSPGWVDVTKGGTLTCTPAHDPCVAAIPQLENGTPLDGWFVLTTMLDRENASGGKDRNLLLAITTNGGQSFDTLVLVTNDESNIGGIDRPIVAVNPYTGMIYVEWQSAEDTLVPTAVRHNWFRQVKLNVDNDNLTLDPDEPVKLKEVKNIDWNSAAVLGDDPTPGPIANFLQPRMTIAKGIIDPDTDPDELATYRYIVFCDGGHGGGKPCNKPLTNQENNYFLASKRKGKEWKFHFITQDESYPTWE